MIKQKWFDKNFEFKYSPADYDLLLNELMKTPEKISQIVSSLPEEMLTKKIDNRWSIKENIGHLIDLEELHDGRIDDFISGKEILRPADLNNRKTDEANHNSKNISQLLIQLKQVRENFLERLSDLDASVRERVAIHPRLNQPMRPIDMAQFVLEHDEHHIQTIKELIARS
ncbi:MAG: DinB family protein [Ignavibacteriaceae bacterium]|nr:DinB family protein [Ignavibacteriaceae bacterium]